MLKLDLHWILGSLAVGGNFPQEVIQYLGSHLGISRVIDLRAEKCDDEKLLRSHGIEFIHLPTEDTKAVSLEMLSRGVSWALAGIRKREKILIHCEHGIGRSIITASCVLVGLGFTPSEALKCIKERRPKASPNLEQLQAIVEFCREWRPTHGWAAEIEMQELAKIIYGSPSGA